MRGLQLAGWALAAVVVAAWLALVEVFWLPLRVGGVPVPVSLLAAVFGNVLLVDVARRLSGSRLVAVLPALVWLGVALAAGSRRSEGDLLITGGDAVTQVVNLGFLLVGVVAAAFAVGRTLGSPPVSRAAAGTSSGAAR
ncbi:hypothetical protein O2W14_16180 [Modestobacter sp. VKM Ac-2986]|uniref:hypothetical protein n=1 Tax=Modestobacter sp. VKM Ac-2986 TaxID=3004140 RepID=UPI0022ABAC42|nr:hypothetical protein [Modestobacter sp. VKM Ac-2986]MCZ2830376.1 hypothetical protein [Modestobacter sp. VKM Ac-2986]